MSESELIHRIDSYNKGRVPEFLARKYAAMEASPFRFFRGSAHLFYEDLPKDSPLLKSPKAWICGDLHLENLGSFKGDNGLAYFDMNDFDEAALAPCLLDIARFACSIHVGARELGLDKSGAAIQVGVFLDHYVDALTRGYIRVLEKETATGVVRQFLSTIQTRSRKAFLAGRVVERKGKPRLDTGLGRYVTISDEKSREIKSAFEKTALFDSNPDFFKIRDIAFRIAGTGSLGMERFALLVDGKPGRNRFALIDIKEAQAPSLLIHHHFKQPAWANQAERIIEVQQRVEAAAPALLSTMKIKEKHFVVRELQPVEDKLGLDQLNGRPKRCGLFVGDVGSLAAWGALRSGGRQGSAIADELIAFGQKATHWKKHISTYASKYASKVQRDYALFRKAYAQGALKKIEYGRGFPNLS